MDVVRHRALDRTPLQQRNLPALAGGPAGKPGGRAASAFSSATDAAEASPQGTGAISRMRGRSHRLRWAAAWPQSTASPHGQVRQVSMIATLSSVKLSSASARRSNTGASRPSSGCFPSSGSSATTDGWARAMWRAMRVASAVSAGSGGPGHPYRSASEGPTLLGIGRAVYQGS